MSLSLLLSALKYVVEKCCGKMCLLFNNNKGISRVVFTRVNNWDNDVKMPLVKLSELILIGKLYLWDCRKKQVLPNIEGFKFKVRIKYQVEKYISTKNNKLETFYEKWPKDISPL